jgi:hypothetical protein
MSLDVDALVGQNLGDGGQAGFSMATVSWRWIG